MGGETREGGGAAPAAETPRPPGVVSAPAKDLGRGWVVQSDAEVTTITARHERPSVQRLQPTRRRKIDTPHVHALFHEGARPTSIVMLRGIAAAAFEEELELAVSQRLADELPCFTGWTPVHVPLPAARGSFDELESHTCSPSFGSAADNSSPSDASGFFQLPPSYDPVTAMSAGGDPLAVGEEAELPPRKKTRLTRPCQSARAPRNQPLFSRHTLTAPIPTSVASHAWRMPLTRSSRAPPSLQAAASRACFATARCRAAGAIASAASASNRHGCPAGAPRARKSPRWSRCLGALRIA